MIKESIISGPLLAIEIGSVFTKAFLFDSVQGKYGLSGRGVARTTLGELGNNVRLGVDLALEELQADTGHTFFDDHKNLIQPATKYGLGVNRCVLTVSAGSPLKISIINVQKNLPLDLAYRLTSQIYHASIQVINLDEGKGNQLILDRILSYRPDLLIINAPTETLSAQINLRELESVRLAISILPPSLRPGIYYLGNQFYGTLIQDVFKNYPNLYFSPNQKTDRQTSKINFFLGHVRELRLKVQTRSLPGLSDILRWSDETIYLSTDGLYHLIKQLYIENQPNKGVLALDIGSESVSLIGVISNQVYTIVNPMFGRHENVDKPAESKLSLKIAGWLKQDAISDEDIDAYLLNKQIFPFSLPLSEKDVELQNAVIRNTIYQCGQDWIKQGQLISPGREKMRLPAVEPIIVSGSWITNLISPGEICLQVLDGLQPTGVTTILLDKYQLAATIGVVINQYPALADLLINTSIFHHLATVVSLSGDEPYGTPILRARVNFDDGRETTLDLKQGQLDVIPLAIGKTAEIQLFPYYRYDLGMGEPGRGGVIRVSGSLVGVVLDGRGRPLQLLEDIERRGELYRKWLWTLGG